MEDETARGVFLIGIPLAIIIWAIVGEQIKSFKAKKAKRKSDEKAPSSWIPSGGFECNTCGNEHLRTPPKSSMGRLMYDKSEKDIIVKSKRMFYCPECDKKFTDISKDRYDPETWIRRKSDLDGFFGGYKYCEKHEAKTPLVSKTVTKSKSTKIKGGNGMKARSIEEKEVTISDCILCIWAEKKRYNRVNK